MQIKETANEGLKRAYTVTIPAKEIDERVNSEVKKIAPQVKMPGFRPGKVPANLVRKMHGEQLHAQTVNDVIRESVDKVMVENKLRPAMQPKVELAEGYEEGKDAPPGQANRRNGTASSVRGNGLPRRWLHGLATTFVQSDPERVWSRTHSTPCLEDHQPNAVGHDGQRRDRRAPDQDKPEQLAAHVSGSLRRAASCRGRPSRHRRCSPG